MNKIELGTETGETCNRNGCVGIIEESTAHGCCSCHINPPCSHCVDDRHYCPECNWQGIDDQKNYPISGAQGLYNLMAQREDNYSDKVRKMMKGQLPITSLEYLRLSHTHFTMICEGVYPDNMTRKDVEEKVKGTFGGRFEKFNNNVFRYIAYTD